MISKKTIFFAFLLFASVLFLSNISADSCSVISSSNCLSNGGNSITSVSGQTNSHVNGGSSVLCCDFGDGSNVCDGIENRFLRISSATNAHAEQPQGIVDSTYTTDACYDGFEPPTSQPTSCYGISGATNCNIGAGFVEVMRLSSDTNAHIEQSGLGASQSCTTKICCSVAAGGGGAGSCDGTWIGGSEDSGVQCDGTSPANCDTTTCLCNTGYNPVGDGTCSATSTCGDGNFDAGEECDGGASCEVSCVCPSGMISDGSGGCSALTCDLDDAYWTLTNDAAYLPITSVGDGDKVLTGAEVYLVVEGTVGCEGERVSFEVFEDDIGVTNDVVNNPVTIDFNSITIGGVTRYLAFGTWNTEWQDDGVTGGPEYGFVATLVGSNPVKTKNSDVLLNVISKTVNQYCGSVNLCGDYYDDPGYDVSSACAGNPCEFLKNTAENTVEADDDVTCGGDILCYCSWDSATATCGGSWTDTSTDDPDPTTFLCGDGNIDNPNTGNVFEECDPGIPGSVPMNLNGKTCATSLLDSYNGGQLDCYTNSCQFNTLGCTAPAGTLTSCGDNEIQYLNDEGIYEQCDPDSGTLRFIEGFTCQYLKGPTA